MIANTQVEQLYRTNQLENMTNLIVIKIMLYDKRIIIAIDSIIVLFKINR